MRIALTGTPGTGKSAIATVLRKRGFSVIQLHRLAGQAQCFDGVDRERNTKLIDINKLDNYIKKTFVSEDQVFFEGHIAHLLKAMDIVLILRCHPKVLRERLARKRWNKQKIRENIDAETIDVILCEAVERQPKENIFEIDTTKKTVQEVAQVIIQLAKKNFIPTKAYRIGKIDWSEEILSNL